MNESAPSRAEPAAVQHPPAPRTAGEMLQMARGFLERKQIEEARLEAELLVAHALERDRLGLFMTLDQPVAAAEIDRARDLLVRRGRREPVAYITGEREFYARAFHVGPGVLIPRPETELLVDRARELLAGRPAPRILDFGTGSGCLAITLALEVEGAHVVALDCSEEALAAARANAERLGAQVEFMLGADPEAAGAHGPFDLIVSNPPYIDRAQRTELAPEVREHEPDVALFAPPEDCEYWAKQLLSFSRMGLRPGGALLVELGLGQAVRLTAFMTEQGEMATMHPDLAGIERVFEVRAPGKPE